MDSIIRVSLNQLFFLRHIRRYAVDFYVRVLEELGNNRLPQTTTVQEIQESVPDILTKKKIELSYEKHAGQLRCFPQSSYIDITQRHDENVPVQTGQDETNNENTIFGQIFLFIDENDCRGDDLIQQHLDNLSEVLTQEIYAYVELTNKRLEKMKSVGSGVSEKLILTGRAILNEIKDEEAETEIEECPKEVLANLDKLQVYGFGFSKDEFCVLAVKRSKGDDIELQEQIKCATSPWKFPKIIWLENEPSYQYIHPGCRLVSTAHKQEYERTAGKHGYGSIGVFGTTDDGQLIFTTAGHIFQGDGEKAYVEKTEMPATECDVNQPGSRVLAPQSSADKLRLIGTCVGHLGQGIDNDADFTLVKVDSAVEGDCKRLYSDETKIPFRKELYTKPPGSLREKFVKTLRTDILSDGRIETEYTDGVVVLDPFNFTGDDPARRRNYIAIADIDSNTPFAKPGHSGAPVVQIKYTKGTAVAKVVSSILFGPDSTSKIDEHGASNDREQDTSDVYKNCVYTWRMDEALAEEEAENNIRVNISDTP